MTATTTNDPNKNQAGTPEQARERTETPEIRTARLRKRLLSEVVEIHMHRLGDNPGEGIAYYDRVKAEPDFASVRRDMLEHLSSTPKDDLEESLRSIEPTEARTLIDGISEENIRRELLKHASSVESARDAAYERVKQEYVLERDELKTIHEFIGRADRKQLADLTKNATTRQRIIKQETQLDLTNKTREFHDLVDEIGVNQLPKDMKVADAKLVKRLLRPEAGQAHITANDLKRFFDLLEFTPADKRTEKNRKAMRKLFGRYSPVIGVGTLHDMGVPDADVVRLVRETMARGTADGLASYAGQLGLSDQDILRSRYLPVSMDVVPDGILDRLVDHADNPLLESMARDLTHERLPKDQRARESLQESDEHDWLVESPDERPGVDGSKVPPGLGLYEYLDGRGELSKRLGARMKKLHPKIRNTEDIGNDTFVVAKMRDSHTNEEANVYIQIHQYYSDGLIAPMIRIQSRAKGGSMDLANQTDGAVETLSYNDFIQAVGTFDKAEIVDRAEVERRMDIGKRIAEGREVSDEDRSLAITDYAPEKDILRLDQLATHLNSVDSKRKVKDIKVGTSFDFGDPRVPDKYEAFSVRTINEVEAKLGISDGFGNDFVMSFTEFFAQYKASKAARLTGTIANAKGVIETLGKEQKNGEPWKKVAFEDGNFVEIGKTSGSGHGKSGEKAKDHGAHDKNHAEQGHGEKAKVYKYFQGWNTLIEVLQAEDGHISFLLHEEFEPADMEKRTKPSAKKTWRYANVGYEKFYQLLRTYDCVPTRLAHEIDMHEKHFHIHEHGSRLMGGLKHAIKIGDIATAFTQAKHFLEHKMEAGGTYRSSKLLSAFANKLPDWVFSSEDKLELKQQLQEENMKQVDALKEKIGKLSGKDRRQLTSDILQSRKSTRQEVMAALLTTIEKNGVLYPASSLSELDGSGIWFKKLAGLPLNSDHTRHPLWIKNYKKAQDVRNSEMAKEGVHFDGEVTELEVIWTWSKTEEIDPKTDATFPPNFHAIIMRTWMEGREKDTEKGKREADNYGDPKKRYEYFLAKYKEGEYYASVGDYLKSESGSAMQSIINKGGDSYINGAAPFMAIMGNMSKAAPQGVFTKMRTHMAMAGKFPYPPFMFMKTPDDMSLFRRVTQKVINMSGNSDAAKSAQHIIDRIEYLRNHEHDLMVEDEFEKDPKKKKKPVSEVMAIYVDKLWFGPGREIGLMEKLNVFRDRTIIAHRDEDKDFDEYVKKFEGFYSDALWASTGPSANEIENDVYRGDHTPIRADMMTRWLHFDAQSGTMSKESEKPFEQLLSHLDMIRTMRDPRVKDDDANAEAKHTLYRKKIFAEYQHAIAHAIMGEHDQKDDRVRKQGYAQELIEEYGFDETLFVTKLKRTAKKPEDRLPELQDEPIEILEFDSKEGYRYAEKGKFDEYVSSPGTNAIEKRTFEQRFNILMHGHGHKTSAVMTPLRIKSLTGSALDGHR